MLPLIDKFAAGPVPNQIDCPAAADGAWLSRNVDSRTRPPLMLRPAPVPPASVTVFRTKVSLVAVTSFAATAPPAKAAVFEFKVDAVSTSWSTLIAPPRFDARLPVNVDRITVASVVY